MQRDRLLYKRVQQVQPKYRMRHVWEAAKSISVCEEDEGPDENGELPPPGHGGCGHRQPAIRKEGLKLFGVYKRADDDDNKKKVHISRCLVDFSSPRIRFAAYRRLTACLLS